MLRSIISVVRWALAALWAVGIVMIEVKPEDIQSNAAAWAKFFGISKPPKWLFYQSTDRYFLVIFGALLFATLIWIMWAAWRRQSMFSPQKADAASGKPDKLHRIEMARRWIRLSDEILLDIPQFRIHFRHIDPSLPADIRSRLWAEQNTRIVAQSEDSLLRMMQKYTAKIGEAKIEMENIGIKFSDSERMLQIPLVNHLCFEEWAGKLGAEGRRILREEGEEI